MGNDNAKDGYSLQGQQRRGPDEPTRVETPAERERRVAEAEQRVNRARPKTKNKDQIAQQHWERYQQIERGGASAGAATASWPCTLCKVAFASEADLQQHLDNTHSARPPAAAAPSPSADDSCVCPICRRRFPTEQALSQHCDQAHDVNTDQQRHLRAQQLEARLKKKSTKAQAKDSWEAYQALNERAAAAAASPVAEQRESGYASDLVERGLELMSPVASETRAASLSMIRSILQKLIGARPEEAGKFGKIKLSNAKVQERIVKVPGAIDILEAAHFVVISLPVETGELEDYLVFQADSLRDVHRVLDILPVVATPAASS